MKVLIVSSEANEFIKNLHQSVVGFSGIHFCLPYSEAGEFPPAKLYKSFLSDNLTVYKPAIGTSRLFFIKSDLGFERGVLELVEKGLNSYDLLHIIGPDIGNLAANFIDKSLITLFTPNSLPKEKSSSLASGISNSDYVSSLSSSSDKKTDGNIIKISKEANWPEIYEKVVQMGKKSKI